MTSSSSSSETNPLEEYEVFISFRGDDTRCGFTSHLVSTLRREGIKPFFDEEGLNGGDEIKPSLLNAIKKSTISVVIFSEEYASSGWCLDELAEILKCKECGQKVVPIFYHVAPREVGNQTGPFEKALGKLKERYMKNDQKAQRWKDNETKWKDALAKAAEICGFSTDDFRNEADLVEGIVKRVREILNLTSTSNNNGIKIIGRESNITEILSLLQIGSKQQMCIVGIWGMAGIGKSTIARFIYDRISSEFNDSYFIQRVREQADKIGLATVQEHLFFKMLDDPNPDIGSPRIIKTLGRKKYLIVLDDVTTVKQIEVLIGGIIGYFGSGSRVIITTRDKNVLRSLKVDPMKMDSISIHEVEGLLDFEALELFRQNAFKPNDLILDDHEFLSKRVIEYAKGVPLALEQLGKCLSGRPIEFWKRSIKKWQSFPEQNIHEELKISYSGLDQNNKDIFLDIACFLKWETRNIAIKFWDACGFESKGGISDLIDKCLIFILDDKVVVNDLLQITGWEIVREESSNRKLPNTYSRLWHHEDIFKVLRNNKGSATIEGISLDMSKIEKNRKIDLKPDVCRGMHNMRYLKLHNSDSQENGINKVIAPQSLDPIFSDLKYLCWHGSPLKSFKLFETENLVALYMPYSNVEKLRMRFDNLKYIDLSHSKHLVEILNFSLFPNLKSLILEGCTNLQKIGSSIGHLKKLVALNMRHCNSIQSLPKLPNSLKYIDAHGCKSLRVTSVLSILCPTKTSVTGNFTNCFELDQKELEDTIKGILRKIEQTTMRSCPTYGCICLPGNQIPFQQWFDLKSIGSSLTVDLPSVWLYNEFVTFALCAIVRFQNYQNEGQGLVVGYDCKIGEYLFYQGTLSRWDHGSGTGHVDSDHVFLGYYVCKSSHDANKYSYDDGMTIQFYVKDLEGNDVSTCNVTMCGFHFIASSRDGESNRTNPRS